MEIVQIYPRGNIEFADQFVLSVLFGKEELLSMGMQEGQTELADLYIEEDEFEIRVKTFPLKPMTPEEAILQMNLIGHDFFAFTDAETQKVGVVYKRKDGGYGLIVQE